MMANKTVCIDEVKGCEGNCITMNDYRVAGPKPWGGGIVVKNWAADVDNIIRALRDNDVVKVVRCKDCKHYVLQACACRHDNFNGIISMEGFCSYGERKNNE